MYKKIFIADGWIAGINVIVDADDGVNLFGIIAKVVFTIKNTLAKGVSGFQCGDYICKHMMPIYLMTIHLCNQPTQDKHIDK